ncbi:MAG: cytochrome c biogenesis protein CcsA [Muribaculaceae bacterium]|nr:cytochrome c biogenesis protein CcsA [Muribaculaceae bacterium]
MRISDNISAVFLRMILFLLPFLTAEGIKGEKIAGIARHQADSLARQTVLYDGIPVTFNTLSRDLLKKVYGKETYRGLTSEQVVASMRLYPVEWKDEPLIRVKDKELGVKIGAKGKWVSLSSLFDSDGSYRITPLYAGADRKETRSIEELDEKVGILLGIISGELVVKDDAVRLPEWRVNLELFYNRIPFLKLIFIFLFAGAVSGGLYFLWRKFNGKSDSQRVLIINGFFLSVAFSVSLINFILEWILAGRIPLSNTGETLSFTVLVGTLLTVLLMMIRRGKKGEMREGDERNPGRDADGLSLIAMLFWGCVGLVAWMLGENPVVTPLMPALQSPWLSIHVTLVMISYALLALTFVIAFLGLVNRHAGKDLRRECICVLHPGVWFLVAGIVTGSIWAKDAWGAYWSWDPKETWALITLIAYSVPLIVKLRGRWLYIYLLFAFLTVLMTYFGVNYFLGGKHSYV